MWRTTESDFCRTDLSNLAENGAAGTILAAVNFALSDGEESDFCKTDSKSITEDGTIETISAAARNDDEWFM